jgi:NgoFVII restriction endonuclease
MPELIASNFSPVVTASRDFASTWNELFHRSETVNIGVGYANNESLLYLKRLIELNPPRQLSLCLGMARFDGLATSQVQAALELGQTLDEFGIGEIRVAHQFPFHGKLQTFAFKQEVHSALIGSSNLSNIVQHSGVARGNYECDLLVTEKELCRQIEQLLESLLGSASVEFRSTLDSISIRKQPNALLENRDDVEIVSPERSQEVALAVTGEVIRIPIKTAEKSNLNVYFGEGRKNQQGFVKPRHWYEVEIIVDQSVQRQATSYPVNEEFVVYTDDGYRFVAKTSGDYGKNFRSRDDLRLLGRWLKGRLEMAGSLRSGEPVTEEVLKDYGRDTVSFSPTNLTEYDSAAEEVFSVWLMNFDPLEG